MTFVIPRTFRETPITVGDLHDGTWRTMRRIDCFMVHRDLLMEDVMSSVLTRETVVNSQPPAPRLPASLPGRIALEVKRTWCA